MAETKLFELSGKQTRQRTLVRPLRQRPNKAASRKASRFQHSDGNQGAFPSGRFHVCQAKDFAEHVLHFHRRRARRNEELAPQRVHARSRERRSLPKSAQICPIVKFQTNHADTLHQARFHAVCLCPRYDLVDRVHIVCAAPNSRCCERARTRGLRLSSPNPPCQTAKAR